MKYLVLIIILIAAIGYSCGEKLPVEGSFEDTTLTDQNGNNFNFSQLRGKVVFVSYIYTHCPDICHVISSKINVLKSQLNQKGFGDKVVFVSISVDPQNDTPEVLRKHAEHMNLDLKNWYFVTGSIGSVYKLISVADIYPTREKLDDGKGYTIIHRDRVSLVDKNGRIRKHYKGTTFDYGEVTKDIKSLL